MSPKLLPAALLALGLASAAQAQNAWPDKPIRIIVPFTAGSFTDTAARAVGNELSTQLGQPIVVENRGGAGSMLGTDVVAKAAPDGYTFLLTDNSFPVSAALYQKLPYRPFEDLMQVTLVAEAPAVMVGRPDLPTKTLKETLDRAKEQPDTLTFGSGGQGSSAHLAMEQLLLEAGVQAVHVPFKGVAAAMIEIAAGRVDVGIGSVGSTVQYIGDNRLLGLAISGEQRHPMFPEVPTFAEAGYPEYDMMYRFGIMAPAGTPAEIVDRLQKGVAQALQNPRVQETFRSAGVEPKASTPAEYAKLTRDESETWKGVIQRANVKVD
ncbi:tripartite tricarboxylate transporter substrate binding protein [Verticiella sediminum]|uniref:Tripartite tricarboxylate transporter substrate binding protein n=1 Tax=Verticiella sediminum TaxID=1247510 RepID=A0A556AJD4_9BURK|nr:tripartite tricarboxylate transporter substrate binding protein [Verticiella sediminum]TSH93018.1 tripartite tricarboxylate transporter substrate binding protein [Verticiella sediminum]